MPLLSSLCVLDTRVHARGKRPSNNRNNRLMFAMHFAHMLYPGLFAPNEWEFFLGELVDTALPTSTIDTGVALPVWAAPDRTAVFRTFNSTFPHLVKQCRFHDDMVWRRWAENPSCEVGGLVHVCVHVCVRVRECVYVFVCVWGLSVGCVCV
jgi:hypothetical protein